MVITSTPAGAEILEEGKSIGFTPLKLRHRAVGPLRVQLKLSGFLPAKLGGEIGANETLELGATLERSLLAVFDREWQNSLGMIFHPVGGVQFSIWETRVKDYDAFITATRRPHSTDLDQAPDHPVVAVDREDAMAFCRWLTQKEIRDGMLEKDWEYRLPTDLEWSAAAGIPTERGKWKTPGDRNSRIRGVYPWGYLWPPPPGSGNFADQSAAGKVTLDKPGMTAPDQRRVYFHGAGRLIRPIARRALRPRRKCLGMGPRRLRRRCPELHAVWGGARRRVGRL